jgi:MurNAc alpha-1-phosphate uridylyltransferase
MILAAGRGERMRPLTDRTPKPLLRVRGQALIERHVVRLVAAGIGRIVINLAWLGEQIRDHLGDGARYGASITYSEESPRALEPGGGIFRALPLLLPVGRSPAPFAVVNGDIYTDFDFGLLALRADADAHIVLVPAGGSGSQAARSRDFGYEAGRALPAAEVAAERQVPGGPARRGSVPGEPAPAFYTFGCIAVYRPAFFAGCVDGAFPLKPLLLRSIAAQRCSAEVYTGPWEDVGTPERLAALNA